MKPIPRILQALAVVLTTLVASVAFAQAQAPREGTDYRIVKPAQPTEAPAGKVEVIEFFGYWCPHCNDFEPTMTDWAKRNESRAQLSYVPIAFQPSMTNLQKLYYTLDALGKEKELRRNVFTSIHGDRSLPQLPDVGQLAAWAEKNGIDRKKFIDTFNSFTVSAKINRANQLAAAYGVDSVPAIGVAGKYLVGIDARRIGTLDTIVGMALGAR